MQVRNSIHKDIFKNILSLLIQSDFSSILVFRVVCYEMLEITEIISKTLSIQFFPTTMDKLSTRLMLGNMSCSFFKLAREEGKRLPLSITCAENEIIAGCFSNLENQPLMKGLGADQLIKLRENINELSSSSLGKIDFNNITVSEREISLHSDLRQFIISIVNSRAYEMMQKLYDVIDKLTHIDTNRIIDEIYCIAAKSYKDIEFIQLLNVVPININRQIGMQEIGIGAESRYEKMPLIHHVAEFCNENLFAYLLGNGADINQTTKDGKTLMQYLDISIGSCIRHNPDRANKLSHIKGFIIGYSMVDSQERESLKFRPRYNSHSKEF